MDSLVNFGQFGDSLHLKVSKMRSTKVFKV